MITPIRKGIEGLLLGSKSKRQTLNIDIMQEENITGRIQPRETASERERERAHKKGRLSKAWSSYSWSWMHYHFAFLSSSFALSFLHRSLYHLLLKLLFCFQTNSIHNPIPRIFLFNFLGNEIGPFNHA